MKFCRCCKFSMTQKEVNPFDDSERWRNDPPVYIYIKCLI